jgi:hypothetical protein
MHSVPRPAEISQESCFQPIMFGRFWVIPEGQELINADLYRRAKNWQISWHGI